MPAKTVALGGLIRRRRNASANCNFLLAVSLAFWQRIVACPPGRCNGRDGSLRFAHRRPTDQIALLRVQQRLSSSARGITFRPCMW